MDVLNALASVFGEGELEGREVAQIALRVADAALERYDDKKLSPDELLELVSIAYAEFKKEADD